VIAFVSSLLLKLPPEQAHSCALLFLKVFQVFKKLLGIRLPEGRILLKIPPKHELKFRSRLGLAAGFDKTAEVFPGLLHLGFGFVETGTVTPLPQPGNPPPRIWRVTPYSLVNHMGFNSNGLDAFRTNLQKYRFWAQAPVFANIGKNKTTPMEEAVGDYEKGIQALADLVAGFVINISSPNTPGLRDLQSVSFLESLIPVLPKEKPVFIKLAPDLNEPEFQEMCQFIDEAESISGVVLTNTSRALSEKRGFLSGGLSGPPLLPISLSWIEKAKGILQGRKLIIGVGGVSSLDEALQMREAGADLVEIYTAFVYQGPKLVREITKVF